MHINFVLCAAVQIGGSGSSSADGLLKVANSIYSRAAKSACRFIVALMPHYERIWYVDVDYTLNNFCALVVCLFLTFAFVGSPTARSSLTLAATSGMLFTIQCLLVSLRIHVDVSQSFRT